MRSRIRIAAVAAVALAAAPALAAPKKTPELVAKGKASFEVNCSACHGPRGRGDGPAAASLAPKPRDLVSAAYAQGASPEQVFATLAKGVPGTGMIPFAHLPEEERWALTYFVLDLRGGKGAKK